MTSHSIRKAMVLMTALVLLSSAAFSETRYDRDLVVKDETRAMKVEKVFKELIAAYEDEDPQGFLDLVSDDRFRQDYITFTDALYSDFRNYEIHRVDYWVDRVVSDHIKQFLFVKWEKRYETLESGRQNTLAGYSRFLFDEINGKYLLIELAGNPLFGGSLQEWREETPPISGQVVPVVKAEKNTTGTEPPPATTGGNTSQVLCTNANLSLCMAQSDCQGAGGYWSNGACYASALDACQASGRYWDYDTGQCFSDAQAACTAKGWTWESGTCTQPIYDLELSMFSYSISEVYFEITNHGNIPISSPTLRIFYNSTVGFSPESVVLKITIQPGETLMGAEVNPNSDNADHYDKAELILPNGAQDRTPSNNTAGVTPM